MNAPLEVIGGRDDQRAAQNRLAGLRVSPTHPLGRRSPTAREFDFSAACVIVFKPAMHALLLLKMLSRKLRPGFISAAVSLKLQHRFTRLYCTNPRARPP